MTNMRRCASAKSRVPYRASTSSRKRDISVSVIRCFDRFVLIRHVSIGGSVLPVLSLIVTRLRVIRYSTSIFRAIRCFTFTVPNLFIYPACVWSIGDNERMSETQETLGGDSMRIESPNLTDKFHTCQKRIHQENIKRKQICGNTPFLTVVGYDGSRKPLCKMHARDEWIEEYDS